VRYLKGEELAMWVHRSIDKLIRSYERIVDNTYLLNFYCPTYGEKVEIKIKDYNTRNLKNAKLIPLKVSDKAQTTSVTIDEFCLKTGAVPTHIKLDIEGGEVYALDGMIDTLTRSKPKLFIEFHEIFIRERLNLPNNVIENFFATLTELGYRLEFNAHHYPLFSNSSAFYDYQWFDRKPNSDLYAVVGY